MSAFGAKRTLRSWSAMPAFGGKDGFRTFLGIQQQHIYRLTWEVPPRCRLFLAK